MRKIRPFLEIIHLFVVFALLSACVVGEGGKKKANCLPDQKFDTISRSCQGATVERSPPTPTKSNANFSEDSGVVQVPLTYTDREGDLATTCEVRSLMGLGVRKYLDISNVRFFSKATVLDAHNTYVRLNPTGASPINVTATGGAQALSITRILTIEYNSSSHSQNDIVNAIQADPSADSWVDVSSVGAGTVTGNASYENITSISCSCSGGYCQASVTPVDNFPAKSLNNINLNNSLSVYREWPSTPGSQAMGNIGYSDFEYRLMDGDGTSAWKTVQLQISEVNDSPVIFGTLNSFNILEPEDATVDSSHDLRNSAGITFEEIEEQNIYFCEVLGTQQGDSTLDSLTGLLTYRVGRDFNGSDSFTFKVCDNASCPSTGCSNNRTLMINVSATADPFRGGDLTGQWGLNLSAFDEDGLADGTTDIINNLFFQDTDGGEMAISCAFDRANSTGVYASTNCSCVGGVCSIGITGKAHYHGNNARIAYRITSNTSPDAVGELSYYTVTINAVDDNPVAFGTLDTTVSHVANFAGGNTTEDANFSGRLRFNESPSHVPPTVSFTVASPFLADASDSVTAYEIVSQPVNGTLTACMGLGGASTTDRECTYTPINGNLNDSANLSDSPIDKGSVLSGSGYLRFIAKEFGDSSNSLKVQLIDAEGVGGGNEEVWLDGDTVKILYQVGVSNANAVSTAVINGASEIGNLLEVQVVSNTVLPAGDEAVYTLSSGTPTADKFVYRVRDSDNRYSANKTFHISIVPVDDRPVVCEYSSYSQQPSCGLNGCIGNGAPTSLVGISEGASYYDKMSSACWKYTSGSWGLVESLIKDRTVNELQTIIIDKIVIDEGGGDTSEDIQNIRLVNIDSSNTALVPVENIKLVFSGDSTCDTLSDNCSGVSPLPLTFEGLGDAQDSSMALYVTPVAGQTGNSVIELTFDDGVEQTEVEFKLTVNPNSAIHGGWVTLNATGPKVNNFGHVVESRMHCPYSFDLCEGGNKCTGSASPVNNSAFTPDNVNAVYLHESGSNTYACFRIRRMMVQNVLYSPKTTSFVSIRYIDTVSAGSESVSTTGAGTSSNPYIITVAIEDDTSTTNQIIAAITADSSANSLIAVLNQKANETQDAQGAVALGNLSEANWESFETTCAITPTDFEPACSLYGETCQGKGAPTVTPTIVDARYWDEEGGVCYRSKGSSGSSDWIAYDAVGEVSLTWNEFSVSGSGTISEYRVFRRLPNEEFDYDAPLNRQVISAGGSTKITFVDNYKNSFEPPIPNTVYFYEIKPVIGGILTGTNQIFKTVRMLAPPKNMSFVHRWMANKAICGLLQRGTDPADDYSCTYRGPGDSTNDAGSFVYDIGSDFLVDRYEAGCAFSVSPACMGTGDGSCVGINDPTAEGVTASNGSVYYERGTGKCHLRDTGAWVPITSTATISSYLSLVDNRSLVVNDPQNDETSDTDYNRAHLPPLVHVTQEDAHHFCRNLQSLSASEIYGISTDLAKRLPNRKEQMAYSQWDLNKLTDSEIATLETGLSINSTSKCNSSRASGLDGGYSDINVPDSNNYYTLPGSDTSSIRSMITGSTETAACVSQFGLQDTVGNVAEWSTMRIDCGTLSTCSVIESGAQKLADDDASLYRTDDTSDAYGIWALDGAKGPCVDANGDNTCDSGMSNWSIEDERFGAGRFIIPLGLVAHVDFLANNPLSNVDLFEIGPTSGITSLQLHDDAITFNSDRAFASSNHCAGMATGGHYGAGNGAGVYGFEYIPCDNDALGSITIQDISYRAKVSPANNISIRYVNGDAGISSISVTGNNIIVDVGDQTSDAAVIAGIVNGNPSASALVEAVVSGGATQLQAAFATAQNLTNFQTQATNSRVDVGFRCIVPIDPATAYDE